MNDKKQKEKVGHSGHIRDSVFTLGIVRKILMRQF